jgi:hypothetical protein
MPKLASQFRPVHTMHLYNPLRKLRPVKNFGARPTYWQRVKIKKHSAQHYLTYLSLEEVDLNWRPAKRFFVNRSGIKAINMT